MNSERCIIWGAGYCGGIALEAYGRDSVLCFADTDSNNVGTTRWGKEIISYDEMIRRTRGTRIHIIAASEDYKNEMKRRLEEEGIEDYDLFTPECAKDIIEDRRHGISPLEKKYLGNSTALLHPELERFHNIHKDQRIFLVGNGPSLRIEDLDRLYENGEISFGFNGIHVVFDNTKWRPNYYGIADFYGYQINKEYIDSVPGIHFFWDLFSYITDVKSKTKQYYFHYIRNGYSTDDMPDFSEDASKGLYLGYSVTYDIGLQMAAYMGTPEIYLIGMDHFQPNKKGHDGNHFQGYLNKGNIAADLEKMTFYSMKKSQKGYDTGKVQKAYERAEKYSKSHGIRIYNATRGGRLEVFERVDFDAIF